MAEYHIGLAVLDEEGSVKALPLPGSLWYIRHGYEFSVGGIGYEYFGSTASVLSLAAAEEVVLTPPFMHLCRPEIAGGIEAVFFSVKHDLRSLERFKIVGLIDREARIRVERSLFKICRAVHIVASRFLIRQDKRIANANIFSF